MASVTSFPLKSKLNMLDTRVLASVAIVDDLCKLDKNVFFSNNQDTPETFQLKHPPQISSAVILA